MTTLERQIRRFILVALLAARGTPMLDDTLRSAITTEFRHITFTAGDLGGYIKDAEELSLIAGTDDEDVGRVWALTPKGKIRAQQLR